MSEQSFKEKVRALCGEYLSDDDWKFKTELENLMDSLKNEAGDTVYTNVVKIEDYKDELHDFLNFTEGHKLYGEEQFKVQGMYYEEECVVDALNKCRKDTIIELRKGLSDIEMRGTFFCPKK